MAMIDFLYQAVIEPPSILPDMVFLDIDNYSPAMVMWCHSYITKYWCYCRNYEKICYTFHFESEEDRAMFILRWI